MLRTRLSSATSSSSRLLAGRFCRPRQLSKHLSSVHPSPTRTMAAATDKNPPAQSQENQPGITAPMDPHPKDEMRDWVGRDLLKGKKALITGGDSGIGRAVAAAFAAEGADVAISYLEEHDDAKHTKSLVEGRGGKCTCLPGDIGTAASCKKLVQNAVEQLGGIDVLVNNAAQQAPVDKIEDLSDEAWQRTFNINCHSFFWVTKAALPHMPDGSAIINTGSVNGLRGNTKMIDYSATKGAVHAMTMSFAKSLLSRNIRVNCVAPGPVWTPLIPATMPSDSVEGFGGGAPMGRSAAPDEIAPSYVFFASNQLSSFYTGEVLAPTGGETLPG